MNPERQNIKHSNYTNHDMIQMAVCLHRGDKLSVREIKELVTSQFPNFNSGSLLPNDHAKGNKGACNCVGTKRQIFKKVADKIGIYIVL